MVAFCTMYLIGSIGYRFIEILWRGHTHWTMGIVGGICMVCIYSIEQKLKKYNLAVRALFSCLCITAVEFISGLFINKVFRMNVWNYSSLPLNLMGQVCLLYSAFWYLLCIPAHLLCKIIKQHVFALLPKRSAMPKFLKGCLQKGVKKNELSE